MSRPVTRESTRATTACAMSGFEAGVKVILETITAALARGDRVELRGFGAFAVERRQAHTGRNPLNGKVVAVAEKAAVLFKMSGIVHRRLNPSDG
jgi:integration host factor subunit beta